MTKLFSAIIGLVGVALLSSAHAEPSQILIDTKFDQLDPKGGLEVLPVKDVNEAALPLKVPTTVRVNPPSTVTPSESAVGELQPPFAVLDIKALPDKPEQAARADIDWDLRPLLLTKGRYQLSCKVTPLEGDPVGLNLRFTAVTEDGGGIWPQKPPWYVNFGPDGILVEVPHTPRSYSVGTSVVVSIDVDLDAETWSASVDGSPLMEATPFDLFTPEGGLMIGGAQIRALDAPGRRVAISDLRVERLTSPSTPSEKRVAADKLPRIACVGDSITQGYGLGNATKDAYPGVLRQLLKGKARIGNFGISGTTLLKNGDSPYWRQTAFERAQQFAPNIVVIKLGTNDSKPANWEKSSEIAVDAAAMVREFRNLPSHPEVIVVLPVPVFKPAFGITEEILAQVRPLIAQGAKEAGAIVIDPAEVFAGKEKLFPDGVHPNAEGAAALAAFVADHLPVPKEPAK